MDVAVISAEFSAGARSYADLPAYPWPEIAVVGRSNSGKSTLVNLLCGRKKLARASSSPGRTRQINLFTVQLAAAGRTHKLLLADLPGFGFARVSKSELERINELIAEYITKRPQLRVLCLLNDIRRDPREDELLVRDTAFAAQHSVLVLASKSDKLKSKEHTLRLRRIAALYGLESADIIASHPRTSASLLWERILPCI